MSEPYELGAWEAAERIAAGTLSCEAVVRSCLERIEAQEPAIKAWVHLAPEQALDAARARDREPARGPLHGVPLGIKDVIDTCDMPTGYGSPIYAGWRPASDAACVTTLKRAGAVILGKTVTTAFACAGVVPTANPHNPEHTSGGSSAGSCAAVAARMIPAAIGTQSAGSTIRPASYNGVVGMKPTFGMISVAGFKYFNASFDHIGLIARNVCDVALLWQTLLDLKPTRPAALERPPRIGLCRGPWWERCEPATHMAVEGAAERLAAAGADIRDITLPPGFDGLISLHEQIQAFETARSYGHEYDAHRDDLDIAVCELIETGLAIPYADYARMMAEAQTRRRQAETLFDGADALLAPAAPGEAPRGHHYLGDSFALRPWTLLHVPTMTVPGMTGPNGLPVGVQLVAPHGADEALIGIGQWVERALTQAG